MPTTPGDSAMLSRLHRVAGILVTLGVGLCSTSCQVQHAPGTPRQAQQMPLPKTAAEVPGPAAGNAMTKEYVQMVGRMAYLLSLIHI